MGEGSEAPGGVGPRIWGWKGGAGVAETHGMVSGRCMLLEKSSGWIEVSGSGERGFWSLNNESVKEKAMRTLREGGGPQVRGSFGAPQWSLHSHFSGRL